ncbi:MAG: hypothetical protein FWH18_05790 [Marinilabiliaceae bacterium]|nr:hypothetical protein [Marinilabiliaceae bacterium]
MMNKIVGAHLRLRPKIERANQPVCPKIEQTHQHVRTIERAKQLVRPKVHANLRVCKITADKKFNNIGYTSIGDNTNVHANPRVRKIAGANLHVCPLNNNFYNF